MKIAYIARWDVRRESGVLKKIRGQVLAWLAQGVDARLFLLSLGDGVWEGLREIPVEVVRGEGLLGRRRGGRVTADRVRAWGPDLAYIRFATHSRALESLMEDVPSVLELNTDDVAEFRHMLPAHKYWYHRLTRGRLLRRARGVVVVTEELRHSLGGADATVAVVANGIDLDRLPPANPGADESVRAVFVGGLDIPWHGVDKILEVAERLPEWTFDLIGPGKAPALPPNVFAHGFRTEAECHRLMAAADVAFGPMALHRKGMDEASPLKVREYLALGIPCVTGYRDTDFSPPPDFILQLPNEEGNVAGSLEAIRAFGEAWKGRRVDRSAVLHLDLAEKERHRLAFFRAVLDRAGGP